ncbi:MAG: response regulator [Bryobacteraceae bacterium]|nr:response regulator [Bryobacteraceae bacterium]
MRDTLQILLVEDNAADAYWFHLVLREAAIEASVEVAGNPDEAFQALELRRPDILFLDLNLPMIHGLEILSEIASKPRLASIPLCVLSGSVLERESVLTKYGLPPRAYIQKPLTPEALISALSSFPSLGAFSARRTVGGIVEAAR